MSTVKRRLQDAGLLGRVAKKNPYLRLANKRKRLRWAKVHRHWTEEVLWTDKSKFEVFGSHRRTFVRCKTSEKMLEECLTPSVKHGGGNGVVWGCFGVVKWEIFYKVKGILNKEGNHLWQYGNHLLANLLWSAWHAWNTLWAYLQLLRRLYLTIVKCHLNIDSQPRNNQLMAI